MSTIKGKVKWFNGKKGYGFIERDDKEKDAFVHISAVKEAGIQKLFENDKLEFELQDGPKGPSSSAIGQSLTGLMFIVTSNGPETAHPS